MRNFYVFVLMLLIGAWANVTQVAAQETLSAGNYRIKCTVDGATYYVATRGTSDDNEDRKLVLKTNPETALSVWNLEALAESGHFAPGLLAKGNRKWGHLATNQLVIIGETEIFSPDFVFTKNADGKYAIREKGGTNLYMIVNGAAADGAYLIGQESENYQWELEEATELPKTYTATWKVGNKTLFSESSLDVSGETGVTIPSYWEKSMASSVVTVNGEASTLEALKTMTVNEATTIEVVGTPKVPEVGKYYRFINAASISRYMKEDLSTGIAKYSENLLDNSRFCVWTLESTGTGGGYYLKNVSRNHYLAALDGNNNISLGEISSACSYYFKKEEESSYNGYGFIYITTSSDVPGLNDVVLLNMNTGGHNKVLAWHRDDWASYWLAEELTEQEMEATDNNTLQKLLLTMDGVTYVDAAVEVKFGETCTTLFGNYKWLLNSNATLTVNGEKKTINEVFGENGSITSSGDATYVFALKMTDILKENTLYQISSAITVPLASQNGRGGKKIYGQPGMIYTKAVESLQSETFPVMARSLWQIKYADETNGYFKLYNKVADQYMGPIANPVVFTNEAEAGIYKLIPASSLHQNESNTTTDMRNAMYPGMLFKIASSTATATASDANKLHIKNEGNNQLMGYDSEEVWSKWYFSTPGIDITKVEYVKSLSQRVLEQSRITPSMMADMTNMTYSTNAQQINDGAEVNSGCLKDKDPSTFFHSRYNNTGYDASTNPNPDVHWLQVDLGENHGMQSFAFYTKKRMGNNNNRPTDIEVQVSSDGESFTPLYTLYNIPLTNDDFYSPSYPLGEGQRYLRFVVKATNTNTIYFTYSEFHIQTLKGVLPDDLAAKSLAAGKHAIDAVCQPYTDEEGYYRNASDNLYSARDNAFEYAAKYNELKTKVEKLQEFTAEGSTKVIGTDVHQYSLSSGSLDEAKSTVESLVATNWDVNNDLINDSEKCNNYIVKLPDVTFNLPQFGQVYRLKSKQYASESNAASYVGTDGSMAGDRLALSGVPSAGNEKNLLLLYTEDKKLVSPITGAELTVYNLNHFDFSEHRSVDGTYRVATFNPDNASDDNARILYANSGGTYGKIDYSTTGSPHETVTNTSWYLESVKSYPVTMNVVGDERWATFYSDNNVFLPDGVKARYMTGSESDMQQTETSGVYKLTYTPIAENDHLLPGGTGVWLVEENADGTAFTDPAKLRFCVSEYCTPATTTPGNSNWFVGKETADGQISASVLYALGKPSGYAAGFYRWKGEVSAAPANKAYLTIPSSANSLNAYGFIFVDGDDATGIEAIQPAAVGEEDGVCYDLTGKRVVNPTRPGIYIKNGKKLVIK